jgi:serine/threonine protein kinase
MGDTTADSRKGSEFGPYRLRRLVGRGGMGDVYEAEDTVRERIVALKLMSPTLSSDPVFRSRMQREARTAGRLQEPHVVPIHDFGEIDGQLYVDMRLIDGVDVATMLSRYGPLSPPRAVAIVRQIGSALDAAHAASATSDEKLTQFGTTVGTFKYMAPERFTDSDVTYRADIYALTCVLYECLTGSPPYRGDQVSVMRAHLHQAIPRTATPRAVICQRPPTRRWPHPIRIAPPTSCSEANWRGGRPRWRPTRRRRAQAGPRRRLPGHQLVWADRYRSRPDGVALLLGARVIRALGHRRGDNRRGAVASPGSG